MLLMNNLVVLGIEGYKRWNMQSTYDLQVILHLARQVDNEFSTTELILTLAAHFKQSTHTGVGKKPRST